MCAKTVCGSMRRWWAWAWACSAHPAVSYSQLPAFQQRVELVLPPHACHLQAPVVLHLEQASNIHIQRRGGRNYCIRDRHTNKQTRGGDGSVAAAAGPAATGP